MSIFMIIGGIIVDGAMLMDFPKLCLPVVVKALFSTQ